MVYSIKPYNLYDMGYNSYLHTTNVISFEIDGKETSDISIKIVAFKDYTNDDITVEASVEFRAMRHYSSTESQDLEYINAFANAILLASAEVEKIRDNSQLYIDGYNKSVADKEAEQERLRKEAQERFDADTEIGEDFARMFLTNLKEDAKKGAFTRSRMEIRRRGEKSSFVVLVKTDRNRTARFYINHSHYSMEDAIYKVSKGAEILW